MHPRLAHVGHAGVGGGLNRGGRVGGTQPAGYKSLVEYLTHSVKFFGASFLTDDLAGLAAAIVLVSTLMPRAVGHPDPGTGPELVQRSGQFVILHADERVVAGTAAAAVLAAVSLAGAIVYTTTTGRNPAIIVTVR